MLKDISLAEEVVSASAASAEEAGLRFVADDESGIIREPSGKTFRYRTATGGKVKDDRTLARIKSLVIPPAWTDVWICARADGHIQATGRDAGASNTAIIPIGRACVTRRSSSASSTSVKLCPRSGAPFPGICPSAASAGVRCWRRSPTCSTRRWSASVTANMRATTRAMA